MKSWDFHPHLVVLRHHSPFPLGWYHSGSGGKSVLEEIRPEKFSNLTKGANYRFKKMSVPQIDRPTETHPKYTVVRLPKTKLKEKNVKGMGKK